VDENFCIRLNQFEIGIHFFYSPSKFFLTKLFCPLQQNGSDKKKKTFIICLSIKFCNHQGGRHYQVVKITAPYCTGYVGDNTVG
jgi:hypothetical protein